MKRYIAITIALLVYSVLVSVLLFWDTLTEKRFYSTIPIYDITFNGIVRDVQKQPDGSDLVTVEVELVHKEDGSRLLDIAVQKGDFIEVLSLRHNELCSMGFVIDERYVIRSQIREGDFTTSACWGTHPYEKSGNMSRDKTAYPVPWENP